MSSIDTLADLKVTYDLRVNNVFRKEDTITISLFMEYTINTFKTLSDEINELRKVLAKK